MMRLKEIRDSITFKVLKIVFSIYFLVTLSVTGLHMIAEYKNAEEGLKAELANFETLFSSTLANALWTLETDLIRSTAQGMLKSSVVVGVKVAQEGQYKWGWEEGVVLDKQGNNTYVGGKASKEDEKYLRSKLISYEFDIVYENFDGSKEKLSVATLYSSRAIVFDSVWLGFSFIVINAVIKTLALWYLFLFVGTKYLSRPLGRFTKTVENVNLDDLETIDIVKQKENNELMKLESSFNKMIENLSATVEDRNKSRDELALSERYMQDVFNSMPSVLVGVDSEHRVTRWNDAAKELTKITSEEASGKIFSELLKAFSAHSDIITRAIEGNQNEGAERIKVTSGNEEKYYSMIVYPLKLSGKGAVVRIDDISDKVQMETMMVQTEKMTSLGTLAAGMAHEINNPLGGILQGVQNVNRRLDPKLPKNAQTAEELSLDLELVHKYMDARGIKKFLDGVKDQGERAAGIVKNVLKFSRRSAAKMEPTDLNSLLDEAIAIVSTDYDIKKQTSFKAMEIIKDYDPSIPTVPCSTQEVEQVLLNLMKNAAHAMGGQGTSTQMDEEKTPRLTLRTVLEPTMVRMEVEDNGPGIPEKTLKRLFEPFFTTKPVGIGTGLGLSIAYGIISDKHHGSLEVESEVGVGTKFLIRLPINLPKEEDSANAEQNASGG